MSDLVQMAGLTVHNFLSAATGIALAVALIRGFARRSAKTIGNFWVDLTRGTLYRAAAGVRRGDLVFVWQGMPQNLHAYTHATTLEGAAQVIAQGPVASQEAIKVFGTNGGGFFNANSAHPFENPTALTNLMEMLLIFSIGAALTNLFGRTVGDERQGWALFAAMGLLFLAGVCTVYPVEAGGNPLLASLQAPATPAATTTPPAPPRPPAPPPRPRPPPCSCTWTRRRARCRPAATWRARRSASASPTPPCSPPSPPTPPAVR